VILKSSNSSPSASIVSKPSSPNDITDPASAKSIQASPMIDIALAPNENIAPAIIMICITSKLTDKTSSILASCCNWLSSLLTSA
jgi:hypothetical protein